MSTTIQISPDIYSLLEQRAKATQSTPEKLAETAIRLQFGNSVHIKQRETRFGSEAYIRGTRVAVRHIAGFLKAGRRAEEIVAEMPHIAPSAIYEAIAYYYDHQNEIEQELEQNSQTAVIAQLRKILTEKETKQLLSQS